MSEIGIWHAEKVASPFIRRSPGGTERSHGRPGTVAEYCLRNTAPDPASPMDLPETRWQARNCDRETAEGIFQKKGRERNIGKPRFRQKPVIRTETFTADRRVQRSSPLPRTSRSPRGHIRRTSVPTRCPTTRTSTSTCPASVKLISEANGGQPQQDLAVNRREGAKASQREKFARNPTISSAS